MPARAALAVSIIWVVLCVGVHLIRALPGGVHIGAPDVWKLKRNPRRSPGPLGGCRPHPVLLINQRRGVQKTLTAAAT